MIKIKKFLTYAVHRQMYTDPPAYQKYLCGLTLTISFVSMLFKRSISSLFFRNHRTYLEILFFQLFTADMNFLLDFSNF